MKIVLFVVRDRATAQFQSPMGFVSSGQAERFFVDLVNQAEKENLVYSHPDDYDLFAIGEFDSESGRLSGHDPVQVVVGKDVSLLWRDKQLKRGSN